MARGRERWQVDHRAGRARGRLSHSLRPPGRRRLVPLRRFFFLPRAGDGARSGRGLPWRVADTSDRYIEHETKGLAGRDLSFLLADHSAADDSFVALSAFPRCAGGENYNEHHARNTSYPDWYLNDCNDVPRRLFTHMGYSTRDARWRFTAWYEWDGDTLLPKGAPVALELYDHDGDQGTCDAPKSAFDFETRNLAFDPAYAPVVDARLATLTAKFHITDA